MSVKLFAPLLCGLSAFAQVPAHTQHIPNEFNGMVQEGALAYFEPSSLWNAINTWMGAHFDWIFSGTVPDPHGNYPTKVHWATYVAMPSVYNYQMYGVQATAKANGWNMEAMLQHHSVDMYVTPSLTWFSNGYNIPGTKYFDGFEASGTSGNRIGGVATYNGSAYTDVTLQILNSTPATKVASTLYVGYLEPFDQMNFTISTARVGGSVSYAYWNGSTWSDLSIAGHFSDGTSGLTTTGQVYFYPPADWAQYQLPGFTSPYGTIHAKHWVRVQVSGQSVSPAITTIYGDDWAVASAGNNTRGWNTTDPNRINVGTPLEYNPNPPANATAKFPYQAWVTGSWAPNSIMGNPSNVQNGVHTWGKYLTDQVSVNVTASPGVDAVFFDSMGSGIITPLGCASPCTVATSSKYMDFNQAPNGFQADYTVTTQEMSARLHGQYGSNFAVGGNDPPLSFLPYLDFDYIEWFYVSAFAPFPAYNANGTTSEKYDNSLSANNPNGVKWTFTCADGALWQPASTLYPSQTGFSSWHWTDLANRTPMECLAMHYMGWNPNAGFAYHTGGVYYYTTDEVVTYGIPTTITAPVSMDTSTGSKTVTLASASSCTKAIQYASKVPVLLGTAGAGDFVNGTLSGTTITTTMPIYHAYPSGATATCLVNQHLSTMVSPSVGQVYEWTHWFPAMSADIGVPDANGYRGGVRAISAASDPKSTPWLFGSAISGQAPGTCTGTRCPDVWRRDFTKAIVLFRPWKSGTHIESELDTPSQPIALGGTYYILMADGTTGPPVTAVQLRGGEGAILMKQPLHPAHGSVPVCNAGPPHVFRAGSTIQLDGTASLAQDGGSTLTYLWQQLSGPTRPRWISRSAAQPTLSGIVFGSYVFQLTVTDGSNQSTSCTVKHGAVATDDNSVVFTNNPAVDALLGPLMRLGANPWPWFDDRERADADLQIATQDTVYPAWWDAPGPGTVTVTAGSNAVTGAATTFTTTFCAGPANPTTPKSDAVIAVWYNTGVPGQTGRRMSGVTACADDTHLTLDDAWDSGVIPDGSGLSYAVDDATTHYATNWGWGHSGSPGNYYDNVAAYYALYYRSGIDDYLTAARRLADRFWQSPMIDRGASEITGHTGKYGYAAGSVSALGLVIRALELQGTAAEMWPGLHHIWDASMGYLTDFRGTWNTLSTQEKAYHLAMVSYCALYDSDPGYRANCQAAAANSFANIWTPSLAADGSWPQLFYAGSSWDSATSVSLVNGSQSVVGNGTQWATGNYPGTIWFTNDPAKSPSNNLGGDSQAYNVTFVDANHLWLDRSYQGVSGIHGWASMPGTAMLGWGAEPADMGTLAFAFALSADAMASTYPQAAGLAETYSMAAANWIRTYGYWAPQKGMYTYAQGINCQAPIADTNAACTAGDGTPDARAMNAAALRGVMAAYSRSKDSGLQAFADSLYNAMFAKPTTCAGATVCVPDGNYVSGLDAGGYMMTGAADLGNKWFGTFFGFNNLSAWPAYRLGGLQPPNGTTLYTSFHPEQIAGATSARLIVTAPSGSTTEINCSSSPCAVPVDNRQGKYLIEIQYMSGAGTVLATAELPL